jgi:hypothetical protein
VSKAVRLSQFRDVACPLAGNCDGLQAVIQHVKTLFEDNLSDVSKVLFQQCFAPKCVITLSDSGIAWQQTRASQPAEFLPFFWAINSHGSSSTHSIR